MANKLSNFELNAQLQILDARLKKTEQNVSVLAKGLSEVSLAANAKTGATFGGLAAQFAGMASMQGNSFATAFSSIADTIDGSSLQQFMEGLTLQKAMKALGSTTMSQSIVNAATQRLREEYDKAKLDYDTEMAKLPIDRIQSVIDSANKAMGIATDATDTLSSAQKATDNISKAVSKSSIITG